jgi:hypothetical protein
VKSKKAKWLNTNSLPEFAGLTLSFRFRQVFVRSSSIESIMTLKSSTKCSILAKKDFKVLKTSMKCSILAKKDFKFLKSSTKCSILAKKDFKVPQIIDEMFNLG